MIEIKFFLVTNAARAGMLKTEVTEPEILAMVLNLNFQISLGFLKVENDQRLPYYLHRRGAFFERSTSLAIGVFLGRRIPRKSWKQGIVRKADMADCVMMLIVPSLYEDTEQKS